MNEDDLIKLAAKAAGIRGEWNKACNKFEKLSDEGLHAGFFDPLTDDGDALRLAVKLDMIVDVRGKHNAVAVWPDVVEPIDDDPLAATRMAIVRAAAAIGDKL